MQSVLIFAEEPVVAAGLHTMLSAGAEFQPLALCEDRAALASLFSEHSPAILLYALRAETPVSQLREVMKWSAPAPLVLMTRETRLDFAHEALGLGVRAIVNTTASSRMLHQCLSAASAGDIWVEPGLAARMCRSGQIRLSPRQSELLEFVVQGWKNKEIAAAMGLSKSTVKAYLAILCEKAGAKDRLALASLGKTNRIVDQYFC